MNSVKILFAILFTGLLFFQACDNKNKDYLITIKTNMGDIKMVLYDQTPQHKKNFIKLAKEGFYDSLLFHRVINGFMIQTGDPNSKNMKPGEPLGNGGPGYTIPPEFVPGLIHEKGAVAAARQGDNINPGKESSGSQFYIIQGQVWSEEDLRKSRINYNDLYKYFSNLIERTSFKHVNDQVMQLQEEQQTEALQDLIVDMKDTIEQEYDVELDLPLTRKQLDTYTTIGGAPHLDGTYTVFGKVVEGLEVVDKIASAETGANNRPVNDVIMSVVLEEMSRKKIEERYDFKYPEN